MTRSTRGKFEREGLCYFKTEHLKKFDEIVHTAVARMMDAELKILESIHETILEEEETILNAAHLMAEIDWCV